MGKSSFREPRALFLMTVILLTVQLFPGCMAQQAVADRNKENHLNHIKAQTMFPKPFQFGAPNTPPKPPPQQQQRQQQPAPLLQFRPPVLPLSLPQHRHPPPPQQHQRDQPPANHSFTPPPPPSAAVLEQLRLVLQKAGGVYRDPTKDPSLNRTVIITGNNYNTSIKSASYPCLQS